MWVCRETMDALLQSLGVITWNYALKSGVVFTSKYAAQQCSRLLKSINDRAVRSELRTLQKLLDIKIKASPFPQPWLPKVNLLTSPQQILSPALDLIEFRYGLLPPNT